MARPETTASVPRDAWRALFPQQQGASAAPIAPPPPRERGEVLARFARGRNEELIVRLDSYEGHPYVSLERWVLKPGNRRPSFDKRVTVKARELRALADVFTATASKLSQVVQMPPITPHRE